MGFINFKFRTKLIFILLVTAILSIGVVIYFSMSISKQSLTERIGQDLEVSAGNLMENVDRFIYERYNDTQILISEPFIRLISEEEIENNKKSDILKNYLVNLGYYNELFLTDNYGLIIASTNDGAIGKDISGLDFYKQAQEEFLYSSDFVTSPLDGKPSILFSNLLLDSNNEYLGIVIAELNWPTVIEMLDSVGQDTSAYLINNKGSIIGTSQDADENVINEIRNELSIFQNSFEDGSFATDINEEFLLSFKKSQGYLGYLGNDWTLVLSVPTSVAFSPIARLGTLFIYVIIGVSFLVLVFGYFSARYLIRPVYRLTDGVKRIKAGKLTHKITLKVKDEFWFLANTFNEMTVSLLKKTNDLKKAISNLKKEKSSVMKSESRYRAILDASGDGVLLIDSNGKIISMNSNFKTFFGVKDKQFIGKKESEIVQFFHDKWGSDTFEKIYNMTKKNKLYTKKSVLFHKKPYYIFHFLTAPITNVDKKFMGRIWLFRDITDERELENAKYKFISVASHKLRTPLTGIRWNLDMLLSDKAGKVPKKQKELLHLMHRNSLTLNSLVNLLLSISEIEGEKITLEPQNIDLGKLIHSILDKFKIEIDNKKIKLNINKFKNGDFVLSLDRAKIRQVFNAVIENAVFYSLEKATIDVSLTKKGKTVLVKISDTGVGIPEKEKRKMFTKFFRGEKAFITYPDGIGLGLYLANVIVKSAKGKIWFESEEGIGTTFYVKLPNVKKKDK